MPLMFGRFIQTSTFLRSRLPIAQCTAAARLVGARGLSRHLATSNLPTGTGSESALPPAAAATAAPVTRTLALQTCAFGVLAGTTGSMVGLGGAFMVLPWLTSQCGLKQKEASGTSLAAIFLTAVGSLIAFSMSTSASSNDGGLESSSFSPSSSSSSSSSRSNVDYRTAVAMVLASTPASIVGVRAAAALSDRRLKLAVIAFQLCVTPLVFFKEQLLPPAPAPAASPRALAAAPAAPLPLPLPLPAPLSLAAIEARDVRALALGAASGFAAGLFGVGGGLIVVPGLFLFGPELDYKTVLGTSFACMVPTTFVGALSHIVQGTMVVRLAMPIGVGCLAGSFFGARLSRDVDERYLRALFCAVMLASAWKTATTLPPRL